MEKIKGQGVFKEGYGFIAKKVMRDRDLNVFFFFILVF